MYMYVYFLCGCFRPGSLMVTFDLDSDGAQTEQEIKDLLGKVLMTGSLNGYQVSPKGYSFKRIRGELKLSEIGDINLLTFLLLPNHIVRPLI